MVSENSDIGGKGQSSFEDRMAQKRLANTDGFYLSNRMIFIGFFFFLAIGFSGVIALGIAPNLMNVQIVAWGNVLVFCFVSGLVFLLYQRADQESNAVAQTAERSAEVEEMRAQIKVLKSEQKQLRRAYREEQVRAKGADESKVRFLAHLSHDLRTPLNHIIGFADLVSHQTFGPLGDPRYLSYVKDIKKSGEGLLNSMADILEFAELESGQRILSSEEVMVDDLLCSIHERFEARAQRCAISLEVSCFCTTILNGDRMGYERILENLLDNAFRFTPTGGKIRMAAWVADDGVVLEVTDTGVGISKERLGVLMNPFSHQDASCTKEHGGIGLGLAIARSVAELSGGELVIDSTLSIGTTVAVSLPINANGEQKRIKAA